MQDFHISIPEHDDRGLIYEEFYRVMVVVLKHQTLYLREIYPSEVIDDLSAYPLVIANRIVNNSITLYNVIERDRDYTIANAIVRSLADSISSLLFIYNDSNEEQKFLRHYLFIMDGLYERIKLLPESKEYDHRIKKDEFDKLMQQIHNSKRNYSDVYNHCILQIKSLPIYNGHTASIDKIIQKNNWKFKSINSFNNNNSYKWNDLYDNLNFNCESSYFSFLSEFVHGLSTSNLNFDINSNVFKPVYGIATSLLGKMHSFLNSYFKSDIEKIKLKMLSALNDEGMPLKYIEYLIKNSFNNN